MITRAGTPVELLPLLRCDVRVNLELLDQRRFRNGTVYLHYRTRS